MAVDGDGGGGGGADGGGGEGGGGDMGGGQRHLHWLLVGAAVEPGAWDRRRRPLDLFEGRGVVVGAFGAVSCGGGVRQLAHVPFPTRGRGLDHFIPKLLISLGKLLLELRKLYASQQATGFLERPGRRRC